MDSLILKTGTRLLTALMLVFSIFLLFRGHNEPGGGFIGSLVATTAFCLYAIAFGVTAVRKALVIDPKIISIVGLALSLLAGLMAIVQGDIFLTGVWSPAYVDGSSALPLSSVLVFDVGVYLVVMGAVLTVVFAIEEDKL